VGGGKKGQVMTNKLLRKGGKKKTRSLILAAREKGFFFFFVGGSSAWGGKKKAGGNNKPNKGSASNQKEKKKRKAYSCKKKKNQRLSGKVTSKEGKRGTGRRLKLSQQRVNQVTKQPGQIKKGAEKDGELGFRKRKVFQHEKSAATVPGEEKGQATGAGERTSCLRQKRGGGGGGEKGGFLLLLGKRRKWPGPFGEGNRTEGKWDRAKRKVKKEVFRSLRRKKREDAIYFGNAWGP